MGCFLGKGFTRQRQSRSKVRQPERLQRRRVILQRVARTEAMDQPKRPEPEIMPPVPKAEPQRPVSETPPDEDAPQKDSPSKGED
jgi:hypothetical protein